MNNGTIYNRKEKAGEQQNSPATQKSYEHIRINTIQYNLLGICLLVSL